MNRRQFLYTSGVVAIAALLQGSRMVEPPGLPVEAAFQGQHYYGSQDGKIYTSTDQGKTWALHTNLGSMFQILAFNYTADKLACTVGFEGRQFKLILANNGKNWQNFTV